jgi:hypothetical protein
LSELAARDSVAAALREDLKAAQARLAAEAGAFEKRRRDLEEDFEQELRLRSEEAEALRQEHTGIEAAHAAELARRSAQWEAELREIEASHRREVEELDHKLRAAVDQAAAAQARHAEELGVLRGKDRRLEDAYAAEQARLAAELSAELRVLEERHRRELEERGEIPSGLPPPLEPWPRLRQALAALSRVLRLSRWATGEEADTFRLPFAPAAAYGGQVRRLVAEVAPQARQTLVGAGARDRAPARVARRGRAGRVWRQDKPLRLAQGGLVASPGRPV